MKSATYAGFIDQSSGRFIKPGIGGAKEEAPIREPKIGGGASLGRRRPAKRPRRRPNRLRRRARLQQNASAKNPANYIFGGCPVDSRAVMTARCSDDAPIRTTFRDEEQAVLRFDFQHLLACFGQLVGSCTLNLLPAASRIPFSFFAETLERSLKLTMFSATNNSVIFLPMPSIFVRSSGVVFVSVFSAFAAAFFSFFGLKPNYLIRYSNLP